MSREKNIIYIARLISLVFTPFYLPLVGLIALFTFSYLSLLPTAYRLLVLALVYVFTILAPTFLIHFYRRLQGWTRLELGQKRRRMVPYIISILCYTGCIWLFNRLNIYHFVSSIVLAGLVVQIVCAIINIWWKISTHTAGIGGVAGGLNAFAYYFGFNPVWWLSIVLVIAGILGSSRMILRQHSLAQVLIGFAVGFVCAAVTILMPSINFSLA
jgi:membrane-associated phospholipid phosphatase